MKIFKIFAVSFAIFSNTLNAFTNIESFNGEIEGTYTYFHDDKLNKLYIIDSNLELNEIDLVSTNFKKIKLNLRFDKEVLNHNSKSMTIDQSTARLLRLAYNQESSIIGIKEFENIIKTSLIDLELIKNRDNFYLIHRGGGLVLKINGNELYRIDDSFATMNKFLGDIFVYNNNIHHFGGYGLWRTNSTLLKFYEGNRESNEWNEIISNNNIPNGLKKGIMDFASTIINENYYIYGGNNTSNGENSFNNKIYKFNLNSENWSDLGELNYSINDQDIILNLGHQFYIFNRSFIYIIDLLNFSFDRYNYSNGFSYNKISNIQQENFIAEINYGISSDLRLYSFRTHNSKYGISMLHNYSFNDIIDYNSKKSIPLYAKQRSRNDFFIPILIVITIIFINMLYRGIIKGRAPKTQELYHFENEELMFLNTKIELDNNSTEIIKMLLERDKTTSNDVVAKLVENGLSYDYASKVKNRIIESLNEKFKFITNSDNPFISVKKSHEDKRIQILELLKYNN